MLHQRDQHRGQAGDDRRPLALAQLKHDRRVERQHGHVHGPALRAAEHCHRAPGGVEQRHGVHVHLTGRQPDPLRVEPGVVRQAAVMQFGALGEAGRARGVLDLGDVVRLNIGQDRVGWRAGEETVPFGEEEHLPQGGHPRPDLVEERGHRAAELRDQEDAGRTGLVQDIPKLGWARSRVDGDQDKTREPGGELNYDPRALGGRGEWTAPSPVRLPMHDLTRLADCADGSCCQRIIAAPLPAMSWILDRGS